MPANDPSIFMEFTKWLWGFLSLPLYFLFRKTNENAKNIADHKQHVAEKYVPKEDYRQDMTDIKGDLKTIIKTLGEKADR